LLLFPPCAHQVGFERVICYFIYLPSPRLVRMLGVWARKIRALWDYAALSISCSCHVLSCYLLWVRGGGVVLHIIIIILLCIRKFVFRAYIFCIAGHVYGS
jgi:hypothetical protein